MNWRLLPLVIVAVIVCGPFYVAHVVGRRLRLARRWIRTRFRS